MTKNELSVMQTIAGNNPQGLHFLRRVKKDYQDHKTKGLPAALRVFFAKNRQGVAVGFAVISMSPIKMRQWEETFREEGWAGPDFSIDVSSFELMYLYVCPEHRRQGIGSSLLDRVFAYAKRVGLHKIYTYVSDTNDAGFRFYRKNNARVFGDFSSYEDGMTTAFLVWDVQHFA